MAALSPLHETIGRRIKQLRKEKNLTQEELALQASIDRSYMGFIERGEKNVTLSVIIRVAAVFHMSLAEFFSTIK